MNVLEIVADLKIGGAQRVAANISKYAYDDLHFTYMVFGDDIGEYEQEITAAGHSVVHVPSPKKSEAAFSNALFRQLRSRKYDVVHCHTMYSCGLVMLIARLMGVPGRVSHSHTAKDQAGNRSSLRGLYKRFMQDLIWYCGTDYLACGADAGAELYGAARFQKKGVVIKNGIDTSAYRFSPDNRSAVRNLLGLRDVFVIGHVGHYEAVKNQVFLIRLMPEILKNRQNAVLLLYGGGSQRKTLENEIAKLGLNDHVRVMGNVNNIPDILSAFDVFAFPSLFEGTPLALLEAQANGLPCVISDSIPEDACLTDLICRIPLSEPQEWMKQILSAERHHASDYPEALERKYESIRKSMEAIYEIFRKYNRK